MPFGRIAERKTEGVFMSLTRLLEKATGQTEEARNQVQVRLLFF